MISRFSTDELTSDARLPVRPARPRKARAQVLTAHDAMWLDMLYALLACTALAAVMFGLLIR